MTINIFTEEFLKPSELNANFVAVNQAGHIVVGIWSPDSVGAGTWAITALTSSLHASVFNNIATSTDADNVNYKVLLAEGTYTMKIIYTKQNDGGIVDFDIDAVEKTSIDMYNSSQSLNQIDTTTGITIADGGIKTLNVRLDGKNGSSSAYAARIHEIWFYRTA